MRKIKFLSKLRVFTLKRVILSLSIVTVSLSPTPLFALDELFSIGNGIYYYQPGDACSPSSSGSSITSTGGTKGDITIATGNIKQFTEDIPTLVRDSPDFVALQETGRRSVDQLTPNGYEGYRDSSFYKTTAATNQARSTAVLWRKDRWSKVEAGREVIVTKPGPDKWDFGRAITWVVLRDSNGGTSSVVSIHHMVNPNKWPQTSAEIREKRQGIYGKGMDIVAAKIQELSGLGPVMIAGDFNFQVNDDNDYGPRKKLAKVNMQSTFDSLGKISGVAVDYIFYTKNMTAKKQWHIPKEANRTDHPFVFATLSADGSGGGSASVVDGGGCICEAPSASETSLIGSKNDEKIYNYFITKGLSPVQTAGIMGNMAIESRFDPENVQDGTSDAQKYGERTKDPKRLTAGWGLIQWTPGSKIIGLMQQAGLSSRPVHELSTQLDLVWAHLQNDPPITKGSFSIPEFKKITDVKEAVNYFEDKIEGAGEPNYPERYKAAELALNQFSGGASTSSPGSVGGSTVGSCDSVGNGAAAGNAVQTALNYAWPEYYEPNFTKLTPAYKKSVEAAQRAGKYVGGGINPGVDCGGFITRVMQDSGVDPEYGLGGNTESQEKHLIESGKYKKIENPTTENLTPGAIAISSTYGGDGVGHTYMFVGKQPGFETQVVSSSYSPSGTAWRAPMAGYEVVADPNYNWYVLK